MVCNFFWLEVCCVDACSLCVLLICVYNLLLLRFINGFNYGSYLCGGIGVCFVLFLLKFEKNGVLCPILGKKTKKWRISAGFVIFVPWGRVFC